jgi:hypothetical protein
MILKKNLFKKAFRFPKLNFTSIAQKDYLGDLYKKHMGNSLFKESHDREFDIFLNKMDTLMNNYSERMNKVENYLNEIDKLVITSREPIKEILASYAALTNEFGYDAKALCNTCFTLGKAWQSRERIHRVYTDYTQIELLNSYRMYYLMEDLKFAITNSHAYFTINDMVLAIKGLTMLGYKCTEVVELICDKLICILNNKPMDRKYEKYADIPGSGRYNFLPKNQFAQDILGDSNFKSHLNKLMKIQTDIKEDSGSLVDGIRELITYLKDTKELQSQFTDTIDNLTQQYIQIEQTLLNNPEITNNPYIKYELFKLQDKLIESGYLNVDTILKVTGKKLTSEEMESIQFDNTISVLKDNVLYSYPELFSKGIDRLDNVLTEDKNTSDYKINELSQVDELSMAKLVVALYGYSQILNVDVKDDYVNERISNLFKVNGNENSDKYSEKLILFKPEYTKLYALVSELINRIDIDNITKTENVSALGYWLLVLNSIGKIEYNNDLIDKMIRLSDNSTITNNDLISCIVGIARSNINDDKTKALLINLTSKVDMNSITDTEDLIKIVWVMSTFKIYNDFFNEILFTLSEDSLLSIITNLKDSSTKQYVHQLSVLIKYDNVGVPKNYNILKDVSLCEKANCEQYDPVKEKIITWIKEGLYQNKHLTQSYHEALNELNNNLPFKPDILYGYYGLKVGLFILDKDVSKDSNICKNIKRVLEKHMIKTIFMTKNDLLELELNSLEFCVNKEFDFNKLLQAIADDNVVTLKQLHEGVLSYISSLCNNIDSDVNETFIKTINDIFETANELSLLYSNVLLDRKLIDLKVLLLKINLIFSTLKDNQKSIINTSVGKPFKEFIRSTNELINRIQLNHKTNTENSQWFGKRLTVDLLDTKHNLKDKNISIELLDNNYMWYKDYNPYTDWEIEFRNKYDNFNYFIEENKNKYLYNSHRLGNRNVPCGIFPHPSNFRKLKPLNGEKETSSSTYEHELKKYKDYTKYLISNELERNLELSKADQINPELSMKVNILNIKNSLKQNLSDHQIVKFLSEFEFIDSLIKEHLNKETNNTNANFIKRDPKAFINFYEKLSQIKPLYDEYDKTVMKEYYKESELFEYDPSKSSQEIQESLESKMKAKMEETVDFDTISINNPNVVDYKYDIDTILAGYSLYEKDPKLEEYKNNPEEFLKYKRLQAERNIILFKIIVKLSVEAKLSENEVAYTKLLTENVRNANLLNVQEVLTRDSYTSLKLTDLSPNDIYQLNTLPNVDINDTLGSFSLSELILELNHFIDNNTILKFIYSTFEVISFDKLSIPKDYKLFKIDNKEPTLLAHEIKESLWRLTGQLDNDDIDILKRLLKVKRGKGKFDEIWFKLDELSMEHFVNGCNNFDDRLFYLAKWIRRKEKEIENRIDLPPDNLKISDTQINNLIEKKNKVHRRNILLTLFKVEDLVAITSKQLNQFINKFCSSLPMFNFDYPASIIDIYHALLDCPNINEEDRQLLTYYKQFFKLDTNCIDEFLSVKPIEMTTEQLYNCGFDNLEDRIRNANIDFIKQIVNNIIQINQ